MFNIFSDKRERNIDEAEAAIQQEKKKFHKRVNESIDQLEKVNKVLNSGITFKIYQATGHKK